MALPAWMHLVLRLIHDLSHFLLFNDADQLSHPSVPSVHATTVAPPESLRHSTLFPGIGERTIDLVAGLLGVALPRAVTIVSDLPAATAALLRLTEVIPADVVLFLCLSGLLLWSTLFVVFSGVVALLTFRLLNRLKQVLLGPSRGAVTFAPDAVLLPESDEEPSTRTLRSNARALFHQRHVTPGITDTPRRTPIAFSDAAISLSDTVAAHNQVSTTVVPLAKRRPRRTLD